MGENVKEVLMRARELIAWEENWCQGVAARDKNGREVEPMSELANSWCAVGAIRKVCVDRGVAPYDIVAALKKELGYGYTLPGFNDSHSHDEVLAVFDRAISA